MKKILNSADIHQNQGPELTRKLYRSTSDQAKRLDDARCRARTIADLFTPALQAQRRKFCEYCERLIFSDPLLCGKKAEELLWRKGYYEVVSIAKKLKKQEYTQDEIVNIETHINTGIGFYHHYLSKVQCHFGLNLDDVVDFTILTKTADGLKPELLKWICNTVYQSLIYLGDLSRYRLEIYPKEQPTLSYRYYLQAISYEPNRGMPHNQMGTLALNQNRFLDSVYHYMRSLSCAQTFEGTNNNLQGLFEKNAMYIEQLPLENANNSVDKEDYVKRFIAHFLLLIDIWYFNKKVSKVYNLCHQTCKDLGECLALLKSTNSECCDSPVVVEAGDAEISSTSTSSAITSNQLESDMIFKIIVICLLCISKLQKDNSPQLSTAIAFSLAIYSQLVQNITNHIQDSVLNYPLPEVDTHLNHTNGIVRDLLRKGKRKTKRRRRKALKIDSESEASEDELHKSDGDSSDADSFVSDTEVALAESSEDETDTTKAKVESSNNSNGINKKTASSDKPDLLERVKRMDVNDMLEIVAEENTLQSIKILHDWLMQDNDIIKSCGTSTRSLMKKITNLLNLININIKHPNLNGITLNVDSIIKNEKKIPLSEDIILKGMEISGKSHKSIEWSYVHKRALNSKEEAVVRIVKFMTFGKVLTTIEGTGVSFDEAKNEFVCKGEEPEEKSQPNEILEELDMQTLENGSIKSKPNNIDSENKGQLNKMKHMGQLWLASEVRALENRIRGKSSLSPYLVLDADALIKYTFMVKNLVHSRKFIVLVPSAVVSALDDLKREQSEARDAIRWLESQFHRGNRFFRAQRSQERAPIPFIKYPKKKDKEMTTYIQIIECCHYLAEQQKGASNLVTLLIGNQNVLSNGENKEFSYVGLAQSAGVSIESITQFYGKWKKSYKGKR